MGHIDENHDGDVTLVLISTVSSDKARSAIRRFDILNVMIIIAVILVIQLQSCLNPSYEKIGRKVRS